jgi:hypothetical protein
MEYREEWEIVQPEADTSTSASPTAVEVAKQTA